MSQWQQGKLSNVLGTVQSEGVMTGTLTATYFPGFLPLPGLFNHFTSILSVQPKCCCCAVYVRVRTPFWAIISLFYLIPQRFYQSFQSWTPFSHHWMIEKGCIFLQSLHTHLTFWNIYEGSSEKEDEVISDFLATPSAVVSFCILVMNWEKKKRGSIFNYLVRGQVKTLLVIFPACIPRWNWQVR